MLELITPQLLLTVVTIVIPFISYYIVSLLRYYVGAERLLQIQEALKAKKELALMAVRMAEQVYREFGGPEKYNKAAEWLSTRLTEKGIKITDDEIKGLIESSLRELKDAFGEDWGKVIGQAGEDAVGGAEVFINNNGEVKQPIGFTTVDAVSHIEIPIEDDEDYEDEEHTK